MEVTPNLVFLSLGTNLGDRINNIKTALTKLNTSAGEIIKISSIYESPSWGYDSANNYLNLCVQLKTELPPKKLLNTTESIERNMGRIKNETYQDRIIDIDILLFNDVQISKNNLSIPHPHMAKRAFVLYPLNEIAPNHLHPVNFLTINQLFKNLNSKDNIQYYCNLDGQ